MTDDNTHDAARVWTNTYPRRVTRHQHWAYSPEEVIDLVAEVEGRDAGYVSVYSFPNGHTKDDGIPRLDTLFIDFDIPEGGAQDVDDWEHKLSSVLVRVRKLTRVIQEHGNPEHWRASLSGNKGVHLFHDFPAVHPDNGTYNQFKNGYNKYANKLEKKFVQLTGVDDLGNYIDATVTGDLGRLTRLPNTVHEGATKAHGDRRYCVPVTIEELSEINVGQYIKLTSSTREVPKKCERNPNQQAHDALVQYIRDAPTTRSSASRQSSEYDDSRISTYKAQCNENIDVDDLDFVMNLRPCVTAFLEDPERFYKGGQSHIMEMKVITEMLAEGVPIDTIVKAFEDADIDDTFDRQTTYEAVERYISGNFHEPSPITCEHVWNSAESFKEKYCEGMGCHIYQEDRNS